MPKEKNKNTYRILVCQFLAQAYFLSGSNFLQKPRNTMNISVKLFIRNILKIALYSANSSSCVRRRPVPLFCPLTLHQGENSTFPLCAGISKQN
jgi:hypothetical protein